jgi:hypothetical protein
MFDRIELIKALNSILRLMFDEFCQVCSRLAIYKKMKKNSLSTQFSIERYIVFIIISLTNRSHHQKEWESLKENSSWSIFERELETTNVSLHKTIAHDELEIIVSEIDTLINDIDDFAHHVNRWLKDEDKKWKK